MNTLVMREAVKADVPALVAMLIDDELGAAREDATNLEPYLAAFERIQGSPETRLMVAEIDSILVGTLTLTIFFGLSRQGATRANIEAVRVRSEYRNQGIGRQMMEWAIAEAKRQGCRRVQLTTDLRRIDAHRFYQRLGFEASHTGFSMVF